MELIDKIQQLKKLDNNNNNKHIDINSKSIQFKLPKLKMKTMESPLSSTSKSLNLGLVSRTSKPLNVPKEIKILESQNLDDENES